MTSVIQPMDQGIIKNIKHYYRGLIVHLHKNVDFWPSHLLSDSLGNNKSGFKIDILQAARMCHSAWAKVTTTTIVNCFKKAGLKKKSDETWLLEEDAHTQPVEWEANWVTVEEYAVCQLRWRISSVQGTLRRRYLIRSDEQKSAEPSDVEEEETRPEAPIPTTSDSSALAATLKDKLI